ncbi:polysaccharide biosynthesis/export family protein [Mucilaginibacter sp.]|uniref:polysaccharide biosynthesis/export family protein n=1 Tax=Mucilaginibacter sp. TaxID=1882438 RepID=UPI00260260AB|nr:polysaccharide biosynthesis/export family protein [Mucilaginibacter sp.]MDB5129235.1 Polysaccharide export outer membrane protein [Mucilaginibacter sp.]
MKKNICLNIFLFFTALVILSSCANQKRIVYFQKELNESDTINVAKQYVPTIQPGDILAIPISSLNPAASSFFNPYNVPSGNIGTDNTNAVTATGSLPLTQSTANGNLVDANGMIELPLIGAVKLGGLTTAQARDTIKNRLKTYLKEPTVNVRFLNYKISIMGEVARPSVYVIPNEKVTLPEALSMAGDLTIFAKRENVLIVRDNNGKKEFGRVNLNTREIFTSPYYYLHSGDLVYVEQGKSKTAQTEQSYRLLPIILSALSFLAIIFSRYK